MKLLGGLVREGFTREDDPTEGGEEGGGGGRGREVLNGLTDVSEC